MLVEALFTLSEDVIYLKCQISFCILMLAHILRCVFHNEVKGYHDLFSLWLCHLDYRDAENCCRLTVK